MVCMVCMVCILWLDRSYDSMIRKFVFVTDRDALPLLGRRGKGFESTVLVPSGNTDQWFGHHNLLPSILLAIVFNM